jgi:hypothetical protein
MDDVAHNEMWRMLWYRTAVDWQGRLEKSWRCGAKEMWRMWPRPIREGPLSISDFAFAPP